VRTYLIPALFVVSVVGLATIVHAAPAPAPVPALGPVSAKPGRVALLPLEVKPPLASAVVTRFRDSMEAGFTLAALVTLARPDVEAARLETIGTCRTRTCLTKLAARLKAAYLFTARVTRTGKNYRIECELFDPAGRFRHKQVATCDICTFSEAITKAQSVAQDAGAALNEKHKAAAPRPRPRVRPRPRPRPRPRVRPRPRPRPRPKPRPLPPYRLKPSVKQAAWMSGVGGVASLVAGVTLLALNGRPTCDKSLPETSCPYRYNTSTAGAVFTALGSASAVAAAVLFAYAYRSKTKREKPRATFVVAPTRGGAWAHANLRF